MDRPIHRLTWRTTSDDMATMATDRKERIMRKTVIGIPGYGSVEIEPFTTGGFDGFAEETHYTIKAITSRLAGMTASRQQTSYDLELATKVRRLCEARAIEKAGIDDCASFFWE
jgi:hypothetical protein